MDFLKQLVASVPQPVQWAFAGLGFFVVARKVLSYVQLLLDSFVLSGTSLRKYGKKGTWAVVTGASDGLGKEYASQLAAKGFNVVLVSRTQAKLEVLAKELESKYSGLQTKILAMDSSQNNDSDYDKLAAILSGLDVGILINNVGQSHSCPKPFLLTELPELQSIISINCLSTLRTTQVVAPILARRRNGLILTMGSFAGWLPTPLLATYSGSKAFLQQWSCSLAEELRPSGVDVQFVLSYLVVSAMSKVRRPSMLIPAAKPFVRAALSKIGRGSAVGYAYSYTPWWSHAIMEWWVENTIGTGARFAVWYNLKMHEDIRRRALRKAAREAKKE